MVPLMRVKTATTKTTINAGTTLNSFIFFLRAMPYFVCAENTSPNGRFVGGRIFDTCLSWAM